MGAIGRILLIVVVLVAIAAGVVFFVLPPTASRTETFTVERPAASVFARLASTPAGTEIAEGVTQNEVTSAENNVVQANVAYADGASGRAIYTVSPAENGASVQLKLERDLGANPLNRIGAITGAGVGPLADAAAAAITADLGTLPTATFEGLAYEVVEIAAQPFFYVQNCSPSDAEAVTSIISQAVNTIPSLMRQNRLEPVGPLMAVEPRVVDGQYCFQVGYPYRGRAPRAALTGTAGQSPGGTMLRMVYAGSEDNVIAEVYDRMDALLAAARLDDPGTTQDDWTTYEVYNDDPTQAGGSRNREIFYVTSGDISALTAIAPPHAPAEIAAPEAQPADAAAAPAAAPANGAAPAAPAAEAPAQPAPATP
jgi:hypothetical protein